MTRVSILVDEKLLSRAKVVLGTRTPRQTVIAALEAATRGEKLDQLLDHVGSLDIDCTSEDIVHDRERE